MIRFVATPLVAAALVSAPVAAADPEILVPGCTGGQNPQAGECNPNPLEGLFGDAVGASPNIPVGLTPQNQPVLVPLGVLPANLPVTMPLGVTPPNVGSGR
jgi:hypothetical protein